jgi:uncharacterized membrane protein (DUF106 family)
VIAVDFATLQEILLTQTRELLGWLSGLTDGYFIAAALVPVAIALLTRDLMGFLWAVLLSAIVVGIIGAKANASVVLIVGAIGVSLLVVTSRILGRARYRTVVKEVSELQNRIAALESANERQLIRSLKNTESASLAASKIVTQDSASTASEFG